MAKTSILASEAAHFGGLAGDWWDPKGASAMLHKLNPVRLGFVREQLDRHFGLDECDFAPLEGKRAMDVGCGAGLLTEPLARLGASVTGVDAAQELIEAARVHAAGQGLAIDYVAGEVAGVEGRFDLVTAMEVIEHVASPRDFLATLVSKLADDGLLILSTPNKTPLSRLLTITLAEGTGRIPKGTHDYDMFIPPEELAAMLAELGMEVIETKGIAFSPARGLHLSEDLRLNYLVSARKA
ncbi:bifunctional 2-polyprenyl-6-hydroxyphenol methylase/3-demethylubiquinol 3-O-methyltransferase UbiG [Sphingomicrobium astaxanthinifaciens]|uniref:bifunctional 2-polyprenyl-6-hydroxyphenol methylase/3-demethylubiquinol 3-O-methyltransferase UbiG n=1 Tax=Sphingomicrobium astaxanthinifaciens TaxID=1227949 RepID=UPI001FCAFE2A|nr:bifunctional 2-polyprenyl-6-hydroxyphenol methylase/3-demethylubiquinol 3-O-methyltransferase UbiG [Sphingomicrobium astaxanthinifaciens]MCJ7421540.1 bifunctional 2-polyprenyl-6-hydroxyphenol methylase/3-demethylubiquinol 3-O-methyltransferase UbiG [Sphingomicrobium astaxanthinifaciens]